MPVLDNYKPDAHLLKDRVVLITGAYGGLGRALSHACAQLGATVILLGRSLPHLEKLYDELEQAGSAQPGIVPLDLEGASAKDYDDLLLTIEKEFGQLNALIHCAGILGSPSPLQAYDMAEWNKVMATNLQGPILLTQALMPLLDKSKAASIVFTLDDHNTAYWGAYGVSKAALRAAAQILADETENLVDEQEQPRVAVNLVNPGPMRTKLRAKAFPGELPTEVPEPESKVNTYIQLIARTDPKLTAADIKL
ncbi:MAG: SDR family NAD(P)-dependent oxidoreductase [Gammaproteobacteria bacterium]|nr:SDR family NAD(P)-dependent oxidoreductase [Gammaproteobacteria bacterium]